MNAVLFDIGNVFVRWDPKFLYQQVIADPDELDRFLSHVVTLAWHTHHDRGVPFADNIAALSGRYPEYADLIQLFDTRWDDTIDAMIPDVVPMLERLVESGTKCVALTNFPAEKWPEFRQKYPFTDLFHGVVVSGQEKLVKPDPRIYQIAVQRYQLDPERTLFVDDRQPNIDAAATLHFHTHLFDGALGLQTRLQNLGLL